MTTVPFDAFASTPRYRPRALSDPPRELLHRQIVRVAWIITRFCRREFISFEAYRDRFGASLRTFYRDLTVLRDAGMYLEGHPTRGYKMLYFSGDVDGG